MFSKLLTNTFLIQKEACQFVFSNKYNDMLQINLSETEIQRLKYERFHYPCPLIQKRINAVYLKSILCQSSAHIGKLVDLDRNAVSRWLHAYNHGGFEALCQCNYGTNQSDLEQFSSTILDSFLTKPPMNSREAAVRIEEMTGIKRSPVQVRHFMKRNGLRYRKTGHIPAKADSAKQKEWVETKLAPVIAEAQNKKCHLLFMDASHFILQPFICALWSMTRLFIKAAAGRNRINVLGTVHAITKEVFTMSNTTYISADTIIDFLKKIKELYVDLPITIVLDNARYQHCQLVEDTAKKMGITLLFLPSYSPNLNIIERLWKITKKKVLYAKYYDTPEKFHDAITNFFRTINEKCSEELTSVLSLNFQFFKNENALIYPI